MLPRERADIERDSARICLTESGDENCWLDVMPGFKVKSEGQSVRYYVITTYYIYTYLRVI